MPAVPTEARYATTVLTVRICPQGRRVPFTMAKVCSTVFKGKDKGHSRAREWGVVI